MRPLTLLLLALGLGAWASAPAQPSGADSLQFEALRERAHQARDSGNLAEAKERITAGLAEALAKEDDYFIGRFYHDLAGVHRLAGDPRAMLETLLTGLPYALRAGSPELEGRYYNGIGIVQWRLGQAQPAKASLRRAIRIFGQLGNRHRQFSPVYNLANLYSQDTTRVDSARYFYELARDLARTQETPNEVQLAYVENNLAELYHRLGHYEQARQSARYAYTIATTPGKLGNAQEAPLRAAAGANLANALRALGRERETLPLLRDALRHDQPTGGGLGEHQLYHQIATVFRALREPDSAARYYELALAVRDSVARLDREEAMAEMATRYETELKQATIDRLDATAARRNRQLLLALLAAAALGAFLWFALRQRRRIAHQNALISQSLREKDTLLREIHHRVKNNLQMVSSLLSLQSDFIEDDAALDAVRMGQQRVRSMAIIHQKLYLRDNDVTTTVSARAYLDQLTSELMATLNVTGLPLRLDKELADIELDIDRLIPLGLIANEAITNAMKHAFTGRESGRLTVVLRRVADEVEFRVDDDGRGLPVVAAVGGESFGGLLIRTFSEQLDGRLTISQNPEGGGASVCLRFPLRAKG